ncbi:hypothetical protein [Terriglobus sp.]|uniref:hypothetical protein n=1 Tax=Terriglobus sp. TaxID=1889013 RepID=UPI003B008F0D
MFRFTTTGVRVLCAAATLALCAVPALAQSSSSSQDAAATDTQTAPTQAAPQATPAPRPTGQGGRRYNANRQARIERNIHDAYSHRYEVGGGGGYLRFHPGSDLLRINEINFWVNGTRQWNERWGIVGDVRGNYGNAKIPNQLAQNFIFRPQISHYNFMAGLQYRFLGTEKYSVGVMGEGGVTLSKFGGDAKGLPSQTLGLWKDSNANPTFSASVNLDYNVYNNLAARIQPTYVLTTFGSTVQNSLGVNVGFVYRFGRQ